jgi:hypothetical protein
MNFQYFRETPAESVQHNGEKNRTVQAGEQSEPNVHL